MSMNFSKKSISWNIKQAMGMIDKGTITFNNPLQRPADQWDLSKKSLLIDSCLRMFIPPVYALQIDSEGTKQYDILDGKQRLTTLHQFFNDEFALTEDLESISLESGGTFDIAGKTFSQLTEEVREELKGYSLNFYIIEIPESAGDDEEEIIEMIFYRLNNGMPMSNEHLTLVSAPSSIQTFVHNTVTGNKLFTTVANFTPPQIKKSNREMAVLQTIVLLTNKFGAFNSFKAKDIQEFFTSNQIPDAVLQEVEECFNFLSDTFGDYTKFLQKIHISTFSYLVAQNHDNLEAIGEFLKWYIAKGNNKPGDPYRNYCGAGCTKKDNVERRLQGLQVLFDQWLEGNKKTTVA